MEKMMSHTHAGTDETPSGRGPGETTPRLILLVEDQAANRKVAEGILRKLGHRVDTALDGREALAALGKKSYDAVLMDIQMPGMDGLEATRTIRSPDSGVLDHEVPIVAMTAHALEGNREQCMAAGMDGYLAKPISIASLHEAIEKVASTKAAKPPPLPGEADGVFDGPSFLRRLGHDRILGAGVAAMFLDTVAMEREGLAGAVADGDDQRVRRHAHTLKGMAANVSATAVQDIAREIEDKAAVSRLAPDDVLFRDLDAALAAFRAHPEVKAFVAGAVE